MKEREMREGEGGREEEAKGNGEWMKNWKNIEGDSRLC